jgi:hypothetical protein
MPYRPSDSESFALVMPRNGEARDDLLDRVGECRVDHPPGKVQTDPLVQIVGLLGVDGEVQRTRQLDALILAAGSVDCTEIVRPDPRLEVDHVLEEERTKVRTRCQRGRLHLPQLDDDTDISRWDDVDGEGEVSDYQ